MSEGVKRFREPAAWLVLFAIVILMVADLVRLVLAVRGSAGMDAFGAHGLSLFNPVHAITLLLVVGVSALVQPATPRARPLTVAALVVALLGTAGQLVFGVIGLVRAGQRAGAVNAVVDAVGYLGFSIFPVVAVLGLLRILGGMRREEARQIEEAEATTQLPGPGHEIAAEDAAGPEPAWRRDEASGAAWRSAGAAASGARASGWGRPGERGDWTPQTGAGTGEEQQEDATRIPRLQPDSERPVDEGGPGLPPRRQPPSWTPLDRD
ncbi:hypothetical protein CGZ93_11355 [Enemella dayhoffiae]|uniref:Uncharacterized protein n=1 Tax=Enemella dayhoffiae TaxID=2016507 RepID=A0A255GYZ8_9ACTN|nr:hypothetical protein [Enemella dayhoffiae]OYO20820.1 hypothetical protein CGZ93_11355 [Enemella dayhoffiae]